MTTATQPTTTEVAALLDEAAGVIGKNGLNKRHLYDTKQADTGLSLDRCRVDIIGALNIAAHGTPRYAQSPGVYAAERALLDRIDRPSLVTWNDEKGRDKDDAVQLLLRTAAELRAEAAA
ncbi:DUF6197 family protein [Streptomyces himalayensis]|uniref:Uncharacterized protein n=1 Tax=Streptomyces himalayensis subsp. himalayensis TaxID=2756131 RepID=A0A7W0DUT3_9ACTN|nr:hypothetical protein [Streptomyces himalayensis]MBA2951642.1 hypothetical protein [Streptomyces himalayensis subsp. himalayensis]